MSKMIWRCLWGHTLKLKKIGPIIEILEPQRLKEYFTRLPVCVMRTIIRSTHIELAKSTGSFL